MKRIITVLAILIVKSSTIMQAQNNLWVNSAGGSADDRGQSVCTDLSGNVYMTGYFTNASISFGTTTLTNADISGNTSDIYIVKYAPDGTLLWANSIGGNSFDIGIGVSTDPIGNVYLTGNFDSPTITIGTTTLTSEGNYDIFIVKYAPDGNVLWAQSAGGVNYDYATDLSTDAAGNVYLTGHYRSPSYTFGTTTLTNASSSGTVADIFIAKYDANGNFQWAKSHGGSSFDFGQSICNDANGNVYLTGSFFSSAITFGTTTLTTPGVFVTKYASDGTVMWAKSPGGSSANSICTDINGNIFVTGEFQSASMTFGTTVLNNTISSGSSNDIFILKYASNGSALWAKSAGGNKNDFCYSISIDASGNAYITGIFESATINFGTAALTNANNSGTTYDIYLVKYSTNGDVLWANAAGGASDDFGQGVSADTNGNIFMTGYYQSNSLLFGANSITNAGDNDIFIVKFNGIDTGEDEFFDNNEVSVFPNPTNTNFTLFINSPNSNIISLTTITGVEIEQYSMQNTNSKTIDISQLANGVYFVIIKNDKTLVTKKIVKTN